MIQRIQTIFLLLSTILFGFVLFSPTASLILNTGESAKFYTMGVKVLEPEAKIIFETTWLFGLAAVILLISLISIFLYNKRTLQMRFCVYNILLMIGYIGMVLFYYFSIKKNLPISNHSFSITAIFPIITIILTFQAFRGIRRDDLLLKSYDRLR